MTERVQIMEVAPRDGFQSIDEKLPTEQKIAIIEALIEACCPRIEIGSFVSPKAVPQMADMGEIADHFRDTQAARLAVLVPNVKGVELALDHGMAEIVYVFSASEAHNRSNVNQTVEESLAGLSRIVEALDGSGARLRVDIGTSFDCPFDGPVPFETVREAVSRVVGIAAGAEIALCDTTGRANPLDVGRRFAGVRKDAPETAFAFHGHDTFGCGVANALAAWREGVRVFDSSAGGLGGCPFAPGATGNTATEDLVFAFSEGGVETGIDMKALLDVADRIAELPEARTGGHLRLVPRQRAVA